MEDTLILNQYTHLRDWTWAEHRGDREFVAFRKAYVDALLSRVRTEIDEKTLIQSVGSVTPESDYDLTVTGPRAADVVKRFNEEFKRAFNGRESSVVFDTNVYGASFVEPLHMGQFSILTVKGLPLRYFTHVMDAGDAKEQRQWALLKVYMRLPVVGNERATMDKKTHGMELGKRLAELGGNNGDSTAYVNALQVVQALRALMYSSSAETVNRALKARYKNAISTANYYGSETYFTQGAFAHVVGELQSGISGLPITRNEYMDSFLENMGDAIGTTINRNDDNDETKTVDAAAKYVARAMHALGKAGRGSVAVTWLYTAADALKTRVKGRKERVECLPDDKDVCVIPATAKNLRAAFRQALAAASGMRSLTMHKQLLALLYAHFTITVVA